MNWATNPATCAWKKLNGDIGNYMTPHDWLENEPEGKGYEFLYHGGKKRYDAADAAFEAHAGYWYDVDRHNLSTLSCCFPLRDVLTGAVDLPALMKEWCSLLKPWHASAGYFAERWYEVYDERPVLYGVLTDSLLRYPGLQFEATAERIYDREYKNGLYDGPRCANWLIALSDHFLEKLGGA